MQPSITQQALHRVLRYCAGLILVLLPVGAAITTISVAPPVHAHNIGLDGLNADIHLEIGGRKTEVATGILGSIQRPGFSLLGKPIGLSVRPDDLELSLFTGSGALDQNTITVAGHLLSDEQARTAELDRIRHTAFTYYGFLASVAAYLTISAEVLGYLYLRHRKRTASQLDEYTRQLIRTDRRMDRAIVQIGAAAATLILLVPAAYLSSPGSNQQASLTPDSELSGTFLDGWQVTGPFRYLVLQGITAVDNLSKSEQVFYDKVLANQRTTFEQTYGETSLAKDPDELRFLILDDLQGTSGMARIVGNAAHAYQAQAIINLGDLTATGTQQESYLSYLKSYTVDVLSTYAGNIGVYSSLGRHDTPAVVKALKSVHVTVADEKIQKIGSLPVLGANSAYIANFGAAAELIDPKVTNEIKAAALEVVTCRDQPAIVFAHDKELLDDVIASGCAPIVIGGHDYVGEPPAEIEGAGGPVLQLILGSTGGHGAQDGFGGLGSPRNAAPFAMLTINRITGAVSYDTTTVHPDASVTIQRTSLTPLSEVALARFR